MISDIRKLYIALLSNNKSDKTIRSPSAEIFYSGNVIVWWNEEEIDWFDESYISCKSIKLSVTKNEKV